MCQCEHERTKRCDDQNAADIVNRAAGARADIWHFASNHEERQERRWQVDIKHPAPACDVNTQYVSRAMVREPAANNRSNHTRKAEDGTEQTGIFCALTRFKQVSNRREGRCEQRATPNALKAAENNQLRHSGAEHGQITELARQTA